MLSVRQQLFLHPLRDSYGNLVCMAASFLRRGIGPLKTGHSNVLQPARLQMCRLLNMNFPWMAYE